MRASLAACLLAGCASGRSAGEPPDAGATSGPDAKVWRDGSIEPQPDAHVNPPQPDAHVIACHDLQLFTNPVLDLNPSGMGWVQNPIDTAAPLITGDDGIAEHTPPFKAWMGGLEALDYNAFSVTDELYQDVSVPMNTTTLTLTAQYEVRTAETDAGTIYDSAQVDLLQTDGTPIENVIGLSNATPTTAWTAIAKTFAAPQAGQTVRIRITTSNDVVNPTSFYFDTLALTATICN